MPDVLLPRLRLDRAKIFDDVASAATETGFQYWLVLALSGGIATLGLAQDSAAVVIGAMLIAPLLAPVVGLGLGLAVGDARLAIQAGLAVAVSTAVVVITGAVLTLTLPFHTLTPEITARTRPTTLDLAIAVFSGLAGAIVSVSGRTRLSAAVPGVAVAVALVPPLAVAGFGVGAGGNWQIIRGSMLLFGANLAGIVLSGMGVFLVAGMHRRTVCEIAKRWHGEHDPGGLAGAVARNRVLASFGIMQSTWARVGMVVGFAILVAIPLAETLKEIAREARVHRATGIAERRFDIPDRSFIVRRDVALGDGRTQVVLNVATTKWFGDKAKREYEVDASARAGEPVTLVLEQTPTSTGDASQLLSLFPFAESNSARSPPAASAELQELLASLKLRLDAMKEEVALPAGVSIDGYELAIADAGDRTVLRLTYAAPDSMPREAAEMLRRQVARALGESDALAVELRHRSTRLSQTVAPERDPTARRPGS